MANSIEYLCEKSVINIISGVPGINFYPSDNVTTTAHPFCDVVALHSNEILTPGSGVFMVGVQLRFCAKINDTTPSNVTSLWQGIRQALYDDSGPLQNRLTNSISTGFTCYGITSEEGATEVRSAERTVEKTLMLNLRAMPRTNP